MDPGSSDMGHIDAPLAGLQPTEGAMMDLHATMENDGPTASTSMHPYESFHSPRPASRSPRSPITNLALGHTGNPDVDSITPQPNAIRRSTSTPTSPTASLKGKERESDYSAPAPNLSSSKSAPRAIVLPDPFQSSEMEILQVENNMLKKQLDVLVKKKYSDASGLGLLSKNVQDPSIAFQATEIELQQINRMLRHSEAQRKRLERELRYLRSYLLSSVEPYRLPTPESDGEELAPDGLARHEAGEAAANGEPSAPGGRQRQRIHARSESNSPPRRKQTMGDAETEHLLLAAARMSRIRKVVEIHPQSELSHLPQARQARRPFNESIEKGPVSPDVAGQSLSSQRLPPLPLPWPPASDQNASLHSSSISPTLPPVPLPNVLGSPIRTTRVKMEAESPQVNSSNAASIFQNSNANNHTTQAPPMQASISATSSSGKGGNGERKIGRPLGSPNKTKLVSINNTAAVRRRAKATEFASINGGRGRGRGRPLSGQASSSVHPCPARTARGRDESHDPAAAVDGLLLAAQSLYGEGRDTEMDMGEEVEGDWPTESRQEMEREESDHPLEATFSHSFNSKAVMYPPATPASLDGPDMTRFPNIAPTPGLGLPATPGRARTASQSNYHHHSQFPPQTPNTLARNERSALDVLAEEAASASKGPGTMTESRNLQVSSSSARNLAHEMELARMSPSGSFKSFSTAEHPVIHEEGYNYPSNNALQYQYSLGEAFVPDHQGNFNQDQEEEELPLQPMMTIAEQLSQGVDISHPLIDPEDLQAGMTPAAALAKKSRSPYIKWTIEEDEKLILGVAEFGTKWEAVARMVPSRSYHQCRQRWLRGLKSGDALPPNMQHLKPQIDTSIQAYEHAKPGAGPKKVEN